MKQSQRYIEAIYCDDIREEVGNKLSYMGVYSGELTVLSAPVLLPKLCIGVKVVTEKNDPFEKLDVRVIKVRGDEEIELLSTGDLSPPSELSGIDNGSTFIVAQMTFMLSPFQIDGEVTLRIKAITEREELRGMSLRIKIAPPPASSTLQ